MIGVFGDGPKIDTIAYFAMAKGSYALCLLEALAADIRKDKG